MLGTRMNDSFIPDYRLKIRKGADCQLLVRDVSASRKAQAEWSAGVWKRLVQFVNGTEAKKKDAANVMSLMYELGWNPPTELTSAAERKALVSDIIKEAQEVRTQVREILYWIANPDENGELDGRAVKIISEHSRGIKLEPLDKRHVGRSFGAERFLDSISRFVCDSLQQIGHVVRLPEPSPIRICETQHCHRFFGRDGKHIHCEKHRGARAYRSTDQNRRYKFIRDNLRIPLRKLEKKIGRLAGAQDGVWKQKCLSQIHIDRNKKIKKGPGYYLRIC
jgi:hypothetical protein